jgi:hypothetical protein
LSGILNLGCIIEVPGDYGFQIVHTVSSAADRHVVEVILAFSRNVMFTTAQSIREKQES